MKRKDNIWYLPIKAFLILLDKWAENFIFMLLLLNGTTMVLVLDGNSNRSAGKEQYTVCPGSSDPFYIAILYKMGHYFLDILYVVISFNAFEKIESSHKLDFFFCSKWPIFLHACATCSGFPSSKSNIETTEKNEPELVLFSFYFSKSRACMIMLMLYVQEVLSAFHSLIIIYKWTTLLGHRA